MNWLAKLFKGTFSAASSPNPYINEPEKELPIDEAFVKNFKDKGGIFVYVEKKEDLPKVFQTVVSEVGEDTFVFTHNEQLEEQLSAEFPDCFITNDQLATHFLTDCEYLVAEELKSAKLWALLWMLWADLTDKRIRNVLTTYVALELSVLLRKKTLSSVRIVTELLTCSFWRT